MAVNPRESNSSHLGDLVQEAQEKKSRAENAHLLLNTAVNNSDPSRLQPYQACQIAVLHIEYDNELNEASKFIGSFQDPTETYNYRSRNNLMNTILLDEALSGTFVNVRRFLSLYADEISVLASTIRNKEAREKYFELSEKYYLTSQLIPDHGQSVNFDDLDLDNVSPVISSIFNTTE